MEAVKQGSICLGLKSKDHVVLCSLKKLPSELACYQEKMFKVDEYIGMAISGLTADARVLCKYMRNESMNYKLTYGANQPLNRLIFKIAESSSFFIQNHRSKLKRHRKDPMELDFWLQELIVMDLIYFRLAPLEITMNFRLTRSEQGLNQPGHILKITLPSSRHLLPKT